MRSQYIFNMAKSQSLCFIFSGDSASYFLEMDVTISLEHTLVLTRMGVERVTLPGKGPGTVARSEVCPLGMQAAPSSIPTSGTFFRGDWVMKKILRPFSLKIQVEQLSVIGERMCALSTGKLPRRLAQEQCG